MYFDFINNYSSKCYTFKSKYILKKIIKKIDINDNDINYIKHLFIANVINNKNKTIFEENI